MDRNNKRGLSKLHKKKIGFRKYTPEPGLHPPLGIKVHRDVQRLLDDIGVPEFTGFVPDPFQREAVETVLEKDVLVSAPTGSGKTWIALEATRAYLSQGAGVWYATPLKALSNAKYEEFQHIFGAERVGILTGDRKENPNADIIVGTTEILRNQLYDAMDTGRDLQVHLVILDEAHYLGDPDRGVVWEEVLIYLPSRVRLLLLSATVSNATQVAGWLMHIRQSECAVIESQDRPVPLHALFLAPDGELLPFFRGNRLFPKAKSVAKAQRATKRSRDFSIPDFNEIIHVLRQCNLLPAIFFLKSRADCDRALNRLLPSPRSPEEGGFEETVRSYLQSFPDLASQERLDWLLRCRAGAHHAGQLPGWRLLVEKMMALGHLEVIFSTSTVAAGVNFPARSVVLVQSDRFNGRTFVEMTATDLHQMTGRAGRRGMDKVGFIIIVPGKHLDIGLVKDLLHSKPEPLESRIMVNFSMILNLLLSHDVEGVKHVLGLSFAAYHEVPRRAAKAKKRLIEEFHTHMEVLTDLEYVDEHGVPTYDGRWAAQLRLDHPLLIAELIRYGELGGLLPQELAGVIAPFVLDKDRDNALSLDLWHRTRPLWKKFKRIIRTLTPLVKYLLDRGFPAPPAMFWPAAAVYLWTEGVSWDELVTHVRADEGDLAMLMLRTADHLRQLLALENQEPELVRTARAAIQLLMRSPLV